MHDGGLLTLDATVEFFNLILELKLTNAEKTDLVYVESVLAAPAAEQPFLVDVRTPQEFASRHMPGAVNIPGDDLRSHLNELPSDR